MISVKQVCKHSTRLLCLMVWPDISQFVLVGSFNTICCEILAHNICDLGIQDDVVLCLFLFHFISYIIWELCPCNVKSVGTNLSMQDNKNWKACITCICFSHLQTRGRAVTRATKFNNKASRVSVSVPFKLRGYCVESLQRGACCLEDPWEQEHLHSAGPWCSSLWRVPALAIPHHMLSIWPRMSVASESQLARENNDSSVEAFSLLFSLNLTTLFHAFTHLLLYSPKPGTFSQFLTARCRRKHRDSSMDNGNWMALSGAHFLSIKYSVAALCGLKTIAL